MTLVACWTVPLGAAQHAHAFEGVAGWEGDATPLGYAFVTGGVDVSIVSRTALSLRLSGSYLYYDLSEGDSLTEVRAPGASILAGPKFTSNSFSVSILAGVEHRWTSRESIFSLPRFRTSTTVDEDQDLAFVGQTMVYANLSRLYSGMLLVSYEGGNQYAFSRLMMKRQLSNTSYSSPVTVFSGFDVTYQGNNEIQTVQLGPLVELSLMHGHLSFTLRGGVKRSWLSSDAEEDGLYLGVNAFTRW